MNEATEKRIDVKFLCVQPIDIEKSVYSNLILRRQDYAEIRQKFSKPAYQIDWMRKFTMLHRGYEHILAVKQKNVIATNILVKDLNSKQFLVNNSHNISKYISHDETYYELLFDLKLFCFTIIYEIHLSIPLNTIEFLLTSPENNNLKGKINNLYNVIRDIMVKEEDNSVISQWAMQIQKNACQNANSILSHLLKNDTITQSAVSVIHNTGNITCVAFDENFEPNNALSLMFKQSNEQAERLHNVADPVLLNDRVSYSFYGRFHTIILKDKEEYSRYSPIQFHIQIIWFMLNLYNSSMNELYDNIAIKQNKKIIEKQTKLMDQFIYKVEQLVIFDETFQRTIEVDNELIYSKIQSLWSIRRSLNSSKNYLSFFRDYLIRINSYKINKNNIRRTWILMSISIFQILGLLSVWSDYLTLLNKNNYNNSQQLPSIFNGNLGALFNINLFLPLVLILFSIFIIIYLFVTDK